MKIGLDIDGVLANFIDGLIRRANKMGLGEHVPTHWRNWSKWLDMSEGHFKTIWAGIKEDEEFWLDLAPLPYSKPLDFEPDCYVTARPVESNLSKQWLIGHGYPLADVITVSNPLDKITHIQERKLDLFVDDHWETVRQLRQNGINAVLFEAPYQRGHDISDLPKIKNLGEVTNGTW